MDDGSDHDWSAWTDMEHRESEPVDVNNPYFNLDKDMQFAWRIDHDLRAEVAGAYLCSTLTAAWARVEELGRQEHYCQRFFPGMPVELAPLLIEYLSPIVPAAREKYDREDDEFDPYSPEPEEDDKNDDAFACDEHEFYESGHDYFNPSPLVSMPVILQHNTPHEFNMFLIPKLYGLNSADEDDSDQSGDEEDTAEGKAEVQHKTAAEPAKKDAHASRSVPAKPDKGAAQGEDTDEDEDAVDDAVNAFSYDDIDEDLAPAVAENGSHPSPTKHAATEATLASATARTAATHGSEPVSGAASDSAEAAPCSMKHVANSLLRMNREIACIKAQMEYMHLAKQTPGGKRCHQILQTLTEPDPAKQTSWDQLLIIFTKTTALTVVIMKQRSNPSPLKQNISVGSRELDSSASTAPQSSTMSARQREYDDKATQLLEIIRSLEKQYPSMYHELRRLVQDMYSVFSHTAHTATARFLAPCALRTAEPGPNGPTSLYTSERRILALEAEIRDVQQELVSLRQFKAQSEGRLQTQLDRLAQAEPRLLGPVSESTIDAFTQQVKELRQQLEDNETWQSKLHRVYESNADLRDQVEDLTLSREDLVNSLELLKTELTGRIQQVQLLTRGVTTGGEAVYRKLQAEMQANTMKAIANAETRKKTKQQRHPDHAEAPQADRARVYERDVVLRPDATQPRLGFQVETLEGLPLPRICQIIPGETAALSGCVFSGDEIKAINGVPVSGKAHDDVVALLQNSADECRLVLLSSQPLPGDRSLSPRRRESGEQLVYARRVVLRRTPDKSRLGIVIEGGAEERQQAVRIAKILENELAHESGRILPGDRIKAINGEPVAGKTHEQVVAMCQSNSQECDLQLLSYHHLEGDELVTTRATLVPQQLEALVLQAEQALTAQAWATAVESYWYSVVYQHAGYVQDALASAKKAMDLDPAGADYAAQVDTLKQQLENARMMEGPEQRASVTMTLEPQQRSGEYGHSRSVSSSQRGSVANVAAAGTAPHDNYSDDDDDLAENVVFAANS
ncbi:uncharacterized protein MONBRDRAFT_34391 [Monosiga brevicollis MX1]|uniref:PDZ domain-containing protein n=1 Tax=Monosiga brevicollis TaxID=81824 RepID=A9VBD5_MONBE|nr:uncharacterized protein MONBRDRAFT_34391 [Monosiga brevicollis MX1]EDQ85218.1 predicted protein [Monosiga brevicollis MX1]|eukprot:XP_001750043.1 hypothetical protein [Monosiga brevicollis MX1]